MRDFNRFKKAIEKFIWINLIPPKIYIKLRFKKVFGFFPSFSDPKSFNEKLQWKKFYDRKEIYTLCSDKCKVRDYIKKKIGEEYLIPLFYVTKNPKNIVFRNLPNQFIIKSNHASGQNIVVWDKEKIDETKIINEAENWVRINFYYLHKEWEYKNIDPRILIQKLLVDEEGKIPRDYKFHCFNGNAELIQVDLDRFGDHKRSYFNKNWKLMPFTFCSKKDNKPVYKINKSIKKPGNLKEMIEIAEKLSKDFNYVRVDLYSVKNKIYFGEFTFTPGAGFECFFPGIYDKIYGSKLKIHC